MIIGAIDVGSNSIKLLVARVKGRTVTPLAHASKVTRLGGGVDRTGRISEAAQDRTIATLRKFRRMAEKAGVDKLAAAGTEALRVARNGRTVVERFRRESGVAVRLLSSHDEARLAFLGATSGRREKRLAAIDIGGGSTEIMTGAPGRLDRAVSVPLGAVRLTESFLATDPPTFVERMELFERVREGLRRLPRPLVRDAGRATLLGIGGTCVNVARMTRPGRDPEGRRVSVDHLESILHRLAELPLARRRRVPGVDPDRADIIVAGARILVEAIRITGHAEFTATVRGVRWGLICEAAAIIGPP